MSGFCKRIGFGNGYRYVFAGAATGENLMVGDKLIQGSLVQVAALGLVHRWLVGDESYICQLLQDELIYTGDAAWRINIFNPNQPSTATGFGV
jgi:hypothetical protein